MGENQTGRSRTITLPAMVESITKVTDFLDCELEALECPIKALTQINIAADEIVTNVASYAYGPEGGDVTVSFSYDAENKTAEICFIDAGIPFDPLAKADPDVSLSAEERQIGGLGIFLVKKTMDEMTYRRENGKNILCIRKRIGG